MRIHPATALLVGSLLATAAGCVPEPGQGVTQPSGLLCSDELAISQGVFRESRTRPYDVHGCWPVGTWTFSAVRSTSDCESPPELLPEYAFEVTRSDEKGPGGAWTTEQVERYRYLTEPERPQVRMKVTSGGGGLCEGALEIPSEDGLSILNFKPTLEADGSIGGRGEYDVFFHPQEP